ncbi:MAG: hypothetical protein ACX931_04600 [Saccharospirillum sp.]
MKVWLKRQGHRVGGRLPRGSTSAVKGQGAWQQGGGVGTALHGGEVTEESCGCEQAVAPLANHSVGEAGQAVSAGEEGNCECERADGPGNGDAAVQRIGGCGANQAQGVPDDAGAVIRQADVKATSLLGVGQFSTMLLSSMVRLDIDWSSHPTMNAYLNRFGGPEAVGERFRNRFTGVTFATEKDAQSSELGVIDNRLARMQRRLAAGINYRCNSSGRIRLGSCTDRCRDNWALWTCHHGTRDIAVCPPFFNGNGVNDDNRGLGVIHELGHNTLGLAAHSAGNRRQRGRNPECYASYIGDIRGLTSFDGRCPPI